MEFNKLNQQQRGGRNDLEEENAFALLMQSDDEMAAEKIRVKTPREVERSETEVYGSCDNLSVVSIESDSKLSGCSVLIEPISSKLWRKKGVSEKRRHDSGAESTSGDETASATPKKMAIARRGRGRPPTTGKYVGFGKAQAELNALRQEAAKEEALQQIEEEVSAKVAYLKSTRKVIPPTIVEDNGLASDMVKQVVDAADVILTVATKSGNLKGTFTKALKDSAAAIKAAVEALYATTASEETAKLQADNSRLRAEVAELRKEMTELRAVVAQVRTREEEELPSVNFNRPETHHSDGNYDEMARSIMMQVGNMLNARLESMEERLLPEKRTRPPLAADMPKEAALNKADKAKQVQQVSQPQAGTSKGSANKAAEAQSSKGKQPQVSPKQTEATNEGWSTVTKRGKKAKKVGNQPQAAKPKEIVKAKAERRRPTAAKLRSPRTAAVVITLQPGAEEKGVTYAKVIAEAKAKVDLSSCGIPSVRFRKAATGARILEVATGDTSNENADSLAEKLREVLGNDLAKVSRPIKCAEFRVSGLDDSVSSGDIAAVVAARGGCKVEAVKVGEIKRTYQGTGIALVSCPVSAAKKLGEEGRLLVGWVSARVEMVQPRPLRCYRCLQSGHVRVQCTAETDRSEECYRCGQPGHKSTACSATPKCSICAAANRPSAHRLGSKACALPKLRRSRAPKAVQASATTSSATSCPPTQAGGERVPMEAD